MDRRLGITFAGGGIRSFYQLGLMNKWSETLLSRVGVIATCSAGAFVATLFLSGRQDEVKEFWKEKYEGRVKNFDWQRLLAGQRPTPHEEIYRELLRKAFEGDGLRKIRAQPFPILVIATAFPQILPTSLAALVGLLAFKLEARVKQGIFHPTYGRSLGFKPMIFDARDCADAEELASLIIASSATPPYTSVGKIGRRRLLDGGIIDNAPSFLVDERAEITRNLILLTRDYGASDHLNDSGRFYVYPTSEFAFDAWDFERPNLIEKTVARGEEDAFVYESRLRNFLETDVCPVPAKQKSRRKETAG